MFSIIAILGAIFKWALENQLVMGFFTLIASNLDTITNSVSIIWTVTNNITTNTSAIGLSLVLPYIGTYRLNYNVTSFQQSDNSSGVQKGAYFNMYNVTTATTIAGSTTYGSSTDIEASGGLGASDVGCASASVFHTTTTINNTIVIRGVLDGTAAITGWFLIVPMGVQRLQLN